MRYINPRFTLPYRKTDGSLGTMPAVAAERRRLRSTDISCRRVLSSKPAARRCKSMGHTDRRTLNRYIDPKGKGKGSPYSITERRVPELIPVLGMQSACGDVSHKPGGRLPLLSARPAVTPATLKRAATNFAVR